MRFRTGARWSDECQTSRARRRASASDERSRRDGNGKKKRRDRRENLTRRKCTLGTTPFPESACGGTALARYAPPLAPKFTYARFPGDSTFVFTTVSHSRRLSSIDATLSPLRSLAQRKKRPRGYRLRCSTARLAGWPVPRARGAHDRGAIPRNGHGRWDRFRINPASRRTTVPRRYARDRALLPFRTFNGRRPPTTVDGGDGETRQTKPIPFSNGGSREGSNASYASHHEKNPRSTPIDFGQLHEHGNARRTRTFTSNSRAATLHGEMRMFTWRQKEV